MRIEKKDYIYIGVLLLLIIIIIIINITNNKSNKEELKYNLVENKSTFFTVESCANRYINSLVSQNSSNLMKLIDSSYIKENNINEANIISKLDNFEFDKYTFKAKKIYKEKIDNNTSKYYIYGLLQKVYIDEFDYGTDYYLIIIINEDNNLFSVIPDNGDIFKGVING